MRCATEEDTGIRSTDSEAKGDEDSAKFLIPETTSLFQTIKSFKQ